MLRWQCARHHVAEARGAHHADHEVGGLLPAAPHLAQLEAAHAHDKQQAAHTHELERGEEAGTRRTQPCPPLLPRLHPRPAGGGRCGRLLLQVLRTTLLPLTHHRAHETAE